MNSPYLHYRGNDLKKVIAWLEGNCQEPFHIVQTYPVFYGYRGELEKVREVSLVRDNASPLERKRLFKPNQNRYWRIARAKRRSQRFRTRYARHAMWPLGPKPRRMTVTFDNVADWMLALLRWS